MTLVLRKLLASSTFAIAGALTTISDAAEDEACEAGASRVARRRARSRTTKRSRRRARSGSDDEAGEPLSSRPSARRSSAEIADLERSPSWRRRSSTTPRATRCSRRCTSRIAKAAELGAAREGDHLHRVAPDAGLPAALPRGQPMARRHRALQRLEHRPSSRAIYDALAGEAQGHRPGHRLPDRRHALGARRLLPRRGPDHDRDRGGGGGHQPPVLLAGRELRPALEPAAHRAADRPLPPLRAEARRGRASTS